jgi:hypothetical protein
MEPGRAQNLPGSSCSCVWTRRRRLPAHRDNWQAILILQEIEGQTRAMKEKLSMANILILAALVTVGAIFAAIRSLGENSEQRYTKLGIL